MHRGKPIKTLTQVEEWCLKNHRRVLIRNKKGHGFSEHSAKCVKQMSLGGLDKMMKAGRLFELHI